MRIQLLVACRDPHQWVPRAQAISQADERIVASAAPVTGLLQRLTSARPDVLLLDHQADSAPARPMLPSIAMITPETRVLLLTQECSPGMLVDFIRQGASGCVLRSSDAATLAKAVFSVHHGEPWFGRIELFEAVRVQLAQAGLPARSRQAHRSGDGDTHDLLTHREHEILELIGQALSNKEIARRLQISAATVKTHLHHIYVKLHKSGRYKAFMSQEQAPDLPVARAAGQPPAD